MAWYDIVENSEALHALYTTIPDLNKMRLLSVIVKKEEASVLVQADMPFFVERVPPDWLKKGYNTTQIKFMFHRTFSLEITGWVVEAEVDMQICQIDDGLLAFQIVSPHCQLHLVADHCTLVSVSGYINEEGV